MKVTAYLTVLTLAVAGSTQAAPVPSSNAASIPPPKNIAHFVPRSDDNKIETSDMPVLTHASRSDDASPTILHRREAFFGLPTLTTGGNPSDNQRGGFAGFADRFLPSGIKQQYNEQVKKAQTQYDSAKNFVGNPTDWAKNQVKDNPYYKFWNNPKGMVTDEVKEKVDPYMKKAEGVQQTVKQVTTNPGDYLAQQAQKKGQEYLQPYTGLASYFNQVSGKSYLPTPASR